MATSAFAFFDSTVTLDTTALVMALLTDAYTPSITHSTWADVSATECADTDYARKSVTGASFGLANRTLTFDSDDISYGTAVSITAKYAVLVNGTAGSLVSTDPIIGYIDLNSAGGSVSSTNGPFSVNTPNGYFTAA